MKVILGETNIPTQTMNTRKAASNIERAIAVAEGRAKPTIDPNESLASKIAEQTGDGELAAQASASEALIKAAESANNSESNENIEATEQNKVSEATSTEVVEKSAAVEEPALSKQYAILARKEKALRAQVQEMKAKEDALLAREEELKGRFQAEKPAIDESKYISRDRIREDLLGVLAESGVSYDQITEAVLQQPKRDPYVESAMSELRKEVQALKQDLENTRKSSVEQQQASYQEALNQIERDATRLINADASFETIKETGQVKEVVKLIEKTYKDEGVLLSTEEAAQMIEDELVDRILRTVEIKKIQERLKSKSVAKTAVESKKQEQSIPNKQQQQMKTLTNSVGSGKRLSAVERAIKVFNGEKID